jgi:hypothetical protein
MAEKAKDIIGANGFTGRIHVHHTNVGRLELDDQVGVVAGGTRAVRVRLEPHSVTYARAMCQVDAIVSEWMGTLLIFEFMIDSGELPAKTVWGVVINN